MSTYHDISVVHCEIDCYVSFLGSSTELYLWSFVHYWVKDHLRFWLILENPKPKTWGIAGELKKPKWLPWESLPLAWLRRFSEASQPISSLLTRASESPLDQSIKSRDPLASNAQLILVPPCQQYTKSSSLDQNDKKATLRFKKTNTYWMRLKNQVLTCFTLAELVRVPPAQVRSRKGKLTSLMVRFLKNITWRKVISWLVWLTHSLTVWSIPTRKRNSFKSW